MSHLLDDEDDLPRRGERELTLSTGAILGIFFGMALICALFFGFGYNMGHKATPQTTVAADSPYEGGASSSSAFTSAKPSAGSSSIQPVAAPSSSPVDSTDVVGAPVRAAAATASSPAARSTESVTAKPETAAVPVEAPRSAPMPVAHGAYSSGNFVVQVAAVSHQEDADLLVNALRRKGYSVAARSESADKLVHIQVGPFNDHKDADTMKLRLVSDGYNAIIKQL